MPPLLHLDAAFSNESINEDFQRVQIIQDEIVMSETLTHTRLFWHLENSWKHKIALAILGKQSNITVIAMASNPLPSNFPQGREGGVRWFRLNLHKKLLARTRSFDQVSKCNSQIPGHHLWITLWMCKPLPQIARPYNIGPSKMTILCPLFPVYDPSVSSTCMHPNGMYLIPGARPKYSQCPFSTWSAPFVN